MNNITLSTCLILMMISTALLSQPLQTDQVNAQEYERVIVLVDDMAVVAILDDEGLITKKIMEIPDYFEQKQSDDHYILKSVTVLSDEAISTALEKNKHPQSELATSESTEPDN